MAYARLKKIHCRKAYFQTLMAMVIVGEAKAKRALAVVRVEPGSPAL